MTRRQLVIASGTATSLLFAYLTFRQVELAAVGAQIRALPWIAFPLALGFKGLALLCASSRSRVLLAPLCRFELSTLFRSVLVAFVGNNLLPLRAGEFMRAGYLARHGGLGPSSCLSMIALERVLDLLCLFGIGAAALPHLLLTLPSYSSVYAIVLLAATVACGAVMAARWPDGCRRLLYSAARALPARWRRSVLLRASLALDGLSGLATTRAVLATLAWTAAFWLAMMCGLWTWMWAFDASPAYPGPLVVLIFLGFGSLLPSSPGQIGTYHYFAVAALASLGVDTTTAASCALVMHFMGIVPFTLIGIAVLLGEYLRLGRGDLHPSVAGVGGK